MSGRVISRVLVPSFESRLSLRVFCGVVQSFCSCSASCIVNCIVNFKTDSSDSTCKRSRYPAIKFNGIVEQE